jgi:hypothetical protein
LVSADVAFPPSPENPRTPVPARFSLDASSITRAKSGEHQVIVYCKQHPELKVIQAIDVVLKNEK